MYKLDPFFFLFFSGSPTISRTAFRRRSVRASLFVFIASPLTCMADVGLQFSLPDDYPSPRLRSPRYTSKYFVTLLKQRCIRQSRERRPLNESGHTSERHRAVFRKGRSDPIGSLSLLRHFVTSLIKQSGGEAPVFRAFADDFHFAFSPRKDRARLRARGLARFTIPFSTVQSPARIRDPRGKLFAIVPTRINGNRFARFASVMPRGARINPCAGAHPTANSLSIVVIVDIYSPLDTGFWM